MSNYGCRPDFKIQHGKSSRKDLEDSRLMCNPSKVSFEDKSRRGWVAGQYHRVSG